MFKKKRPFALLGRPPSCTALPRKRRPPALNGWKRRGTKGVVTPPLRPRQTGNPAKIGRFRVRLISPGGIRLSTLKPTLPPPNAQKVYSSPQTGLFSAEQRGYLRRKKSDGERNCPLLSSPDGFWSAVGGGKTGGGHTWAREGEGEGLTPPPEGQSPGPPPCQALI